jgi:hypothetical protein
MRLAAVRAMELFGFWYWWHRERQGRAVQDEEARDDALGGFRTTVIAGLLRTLTIRLEGTTGAQGQSVQNCTLFKTTARSIWPEAPLPKFAAGLDGLAVNTGAANGELFNSDFFRLAKQVFILARATALSK